MRTCLVLVLCLLLTLSFFGCGKKEAEPVDAGAAGQPEEIEDATRLDSAAGVDSTAGMDSSAGAMEDSSASGDSSGY